MTRPSLGQAIHARYGNPTAPVEQPKPYGDQTAMRKLSAAVTEDPTALDGLPQWQRNALATFRRRERNLAAQSEQQQDDGDAA
jgi:hypothetical protein